MTVHDNLLVLESEINPMHVLIKMNEVRGTVKTNRPLCTLFMDVFFHMTSSAKVENTNLH
jgi:hypothetical protein